MMKYLFTLILWPQLIFFGSMDRIQKAMEKGEYDKALELIEKGFEKEPNNPGLSYYQGLIYFNEDFERYNIDTARIVTIQSLQAYENASQELIEELSDDGVDIDQIQELYDRIRDKEYELALSDLSLSSISVFQGKFPTSIYDELLNFKRDSIEFDIARRNQTESDLSEYIRTHTPSVFTKRARTLLDDMRWQSLENKGTLKDYQAFIRKYPETPYRSNIEAFILKVSTASHTIEKYVDFIRLAQNKQFQKRAADVLYYLSPDHGLRYHPNSDSLRQIMEDESLRIMPIAAEENIGFYDQSANEMIKALFNQIPASYACQNTPDGWILGFEKESGSIVTKRGSIVLTDVEDYRSINRDVGLIARQDQWYLYHKSGFQIIDESVEEAEVLANKWIKVKQNGKWGLVSYLGYNIAEIIYDDIYRSGAFWVFEKDGLLAVYREDLIEMEIEDRGITLEFKFDDIEFINKNALIGFREDRECLLDSTLQFLVPWGTYEIYPDKSGWYLRSDQGYRLYNESEKDLMDRYFPYLEANDGWLTLKTNTDWMLIPRQGELLPSRDYDSVKLLNSHAVIVEQSPEKTLLFSSGNSVKLLDEIITVVPNRPDYLNVSDGRSKAIYDESGEVVIKGRYEKIDFVNDTLIRVQVKGKKGLMNREGKWILNPVFDTIDEKDGLVLTLIKGKIGCYDPSINELIETGYDERLTRFGEHYLAKKNGQFGVINFDSETVISFNYDEITQWNDSSLLVKKGPDFSIINRQEEPITEPLESLRPILKNDTQSIYRFIKDGKYGLISSRYGTLLSSEYSDIFNIGTEEEPLFFADQHLAKAGYHVVSYVNQKGELILSKAYTRAAFNKILCDD